MPVECGDALYGHVVLTEALAETAEDYGIHPGSPGRGACTSSLHEGIGCVRARCAGAAAFCLERCHACTRRALRSCGCVCSR